METITVNGEVYAKVNKVNKGNRAVVVVDRGWIFAGDVSITPSGCIRLDNAEEEVPMEVHVTAELEKKLSDYAAQSGLSPEEVVEEALSGYFEDLAETRAMLDRRYDEIERGQVTLIPGEEAFARLRANIEARRGPAYSAFIDRVRQQAGRDRAVQELRALCRHEHEAGTGAWVVPESIILQRADEIAKEDT